MKNDKKRIILIATAVVIILLVILLILYFFTDVFKSNKEIFFKSISQQEFINYSFIENVKNNFSKKEESSVSNLNLNVFGIMLNQQTNVADTQKILEIKSNRLNNKNLNQTYMDFTFFDETKQLTTAKIIKDGNKYAFGADNILTKYVAVENKELRTFLSKLGIKEVDKFPNTINNNYSELLNADKDTINKIKETYGKILYDNIDKNNFEKIKNTDNTHSIILKLNQKEFTNIQNILLENAKNDDVLLSYITTKTQVAGYNNLNKEYLQKIMQEKINNNLQKTFNNDEPYFTIKITISNKEIINIEIKNDIYNINADISNKELIKINIQKSQTNYMEINIGYTDDNLNNKMEIDIVNHIKNQTFNMLYKSSNKEKNNITENANISFNNNSKDIQISITNITNLKEDIQIEKLTTDNTIMLDDYAPENLKILIEAIKDRINQLYGVQIEKIKTQF